MRKKGKYRFRTEEVEQAGRNASGFPVHISTRGFIQSLTVVERTSLSLSNKYKSIRKTGVPTLFKFKESAVNVQWVVKKK